MRNTSPTKRLIALALTLLMLLGYFPGTAWAVDPSTDIKAITKPTGISIVEDYDDYIGENWLEQLGLPQFVTVTLADDSTVEAPVTWDTSVLDTRETGYYSLPGTVSLPAGATNGQNLTVSITVQVREFQNLLTNGNFDNGTTSWKGLNLSKTADPLNADNSVLLSKTTDTYKINKDDTKQTLYTNMGNAALASALSAQGAGQYALQIKAMPAAFDSSSAAREDLRMRIYLRCYNATSSSAVYNYRSDYVYMTSTTSWTTCRLLIDLTDDLTNNTYTGYRADAYCTSVTKDNDGALYLDDFELVLLKAALEVEPSSIAAIQTEILSHKVVQNYPNYVGEDWKAQLGLPSSVEVLTDNGGTVSVDVTWSYAGLDFTKYGKYTLVGTLDDSSFPNPNGITASVNIFVVKENNLLPNPSFEDGITGWHGSTSAENRDLAYISDGAMSLLKTATSVNAAYIYHYQYGATDDPATKTNYAVELAAAMNAAGAGQYYASYDAKYAAATADIAFRFGIDIRTRSLYSDKDSFVIGSASRVDLPLSGEDFATTSLVFDYDCSVSWVRTDFMLYGTAGTINNVSLYIDNAKLFPINVTIPKDQEPSDIVKVLSSIPTRAVIKDYDKYVGENWKEALGLPETVEVLTSGGNTASVDVEWNYDTLQLDEEGTYILLGTLDNSTYPNPDNLSVTQTIRIREYKNLVSNSSLENNLEGWYIRGANPSPSCVKGVSAHGSYSGITGAVVSTEKSLNFANNKTVADTFGASIGSQGGGQYYIGAWAMQASKATVPGMQFTLQLNYKTVGQNAELSDAITKKATAVELNNTCFVQSSAVVELPDGIAWARIDLSAQAQTVDDISNTRLYFDYIELIPLNVTVEQYEGQMVQVESLIPDRQIVQNFPDYIGEGYTTADLMLPETVEVLTSTGQIVDIDVKWNYATLNLTKLGTYTLYGTLDDLKLANPDALTVQQTINVVSPSNLFTNPGFEQDGYAWHKRTDATVEVGITKPVRSGDFSLKFMSSRMDNWEKNNLQCLWNDNPATLGTEVATTGSGLYSFSGWAHGTASTNDIEVSLSMLYKSMTNGDSAISTSSAKVTLSTTGFTEMSGFVTMPDDVYWARIDLYLWGTPDEMRLSELYLDDFELLPLNVEVPNLTDIISCADTADIYVHEGSSIEDLNLPESLRVVIKNGQKFNMKVTWDTSSYDPNQIGEQTITGSLNLGSSYKNPKKFTPTVKIIVRAKGEDLRQTIYISTSGSEDNDGLSPNNPKRDVTKIATYLKQGFNVRLKRGDTWYLPTTTFTFSGIHATEEAPLTLGAYGNGDEKPNITFAKHIEDSAWTLVDEKRNIYSVDVSDIGQKNGYSVHRCFVNDEAYTPKDRSSYVALKAGEFCSYDMTLYIRMPEGETPTNVDAVPFSVGNRLYFTNVSNLTIEYIHFRCTDASWNMVYADAPTKYLRFLYCDMTRIFGHIMQWEASDDQLHYKPEIAYCYMDSSISEAEGAIRGDTYWDVHHIEGITMRDGVDGAWIHHCTMRQFSHCFIAVESLDADSEYTTTGVRNCIFEDNVMEGGYAQYARAITLSGNFNLSGTQMCRDNIVRRNYMYDMTTAGHFFGENNLIYSNVISYVHCNYTEDGELFDGKNAQPWGFDTKVYGGKNSVGCMLINNTFFNVGGALLIEDSIGTVYNNIYANNLIVNWTSDPAANNRHGGISDNSVEMQYVMNNGVYSTLGKVDPFTVDGYIYSADEVNKAVPGYSGNICADPKFVNADLTQMQHGARLDFTLSSESPMRYAGLSAYSEVYKTFPAWERMMEDYTDINGVAYLAESPSIGAFSFSEKITGTVAEVSKLDDIVARPGAKFDQLKLPDAVSATNNQGIEVMLLATWSDATFDSSKPGTITLTATLRNGPHTDLNIDGKVATINVNIKDKMELLNVATVLENLTILYGTSYEDVLKMLPATLDVTEESGFQESLPVTWSCDNYNPIEPDAYTFKCILPEDMITNAREFTLEVEVRVLHEIGRGIELLVNPDFIDGTSASPWTMGWGTGTIKVTTDPKYLYPGEPASMIVTADRIYASLQQDVTGQMQLMGDGKYLFKMYMRAYDPGKPIGSSVALLKVNTPQSYNKFCRTKTNIGDEWVEYSSVMNIYDVDQAAEIIFHTSTYKTEDDVGDDPRSYVISGCSLIFLGTTDEEVEATLDSIGLVWNEIKGENGLDMENVMFDLDLPDSIGSGSTITWTSSDESTITNDGKVTMGRVPKEVTMTATITYKGIETIKKFTVTVPRNPELPIFTGSLSGDTTVKPGDSFQVTIHLDSQNASSFNVYRFTLSFSTTALEYVGISDSGSTVVVDGGRITVSGIGTERPITDTITLTFRALKSGVTDIKLVKVEMDLDPNASLDTLPSMEITNKTVTVNVQKVTSDGKDNVTDTDEKANPAVIWIVIGLVAAALIAGSIITVILIKKKKQILPSAEAE